MTKLPRFSFAFLHPRYWLSWAGIAALWLIMLLPYPLLFRIGHGLGRLAMRLLPRRVEIARVIPPLDHLVVRPVVARECDRDGGFLRHDRDRDAGGQRERHRDDQDIEQCSHTRAGERHRLTASSIGSHRTSHR